MFKEIAPSLTDLISQCLMEVLFEISNGANPLPVPDQNDMTDTCSVNSFSVSPSQNLSPSPSPVTPSPVATWSVKITGAESTQQRAFQYLLDCYGRVAVEERNHPKKSSIPPLSDLLIDLRAQLVHYTTLVLNGYITPSAQSVSNSLLLKGILEQTLPRGFVSELVTRTHVNQGLFSKIFTPILQELFVMMQDASVVSNEHRQPLQALNELAEIR